MPSYDFVRLALLPDQSQETRVAYQRDVWQLTERLRRHGLTLQPAPRSGFPAPNGEPETIARFLVAFPDLIGATFAAAARVWLESAPGRRMVIGMGDIEVEARTAEDFHRLFAQARILDAGRRRSEALLHEPARHAVVLEEHHA